MANIKAGYQVAMRSWENDADNYKTVTKSGLTEEEAKFTVEVALLFGRGKGNQNIVLKDLYTDVETIYKRYAFTEGTMFEMWNETFNPSAGDEEYVEEWLRDIITENYTESPGEWYDYNFFRVIDKITVHYFPEEGVDKTSEFV